MSYLARSDSRRWMSASTIAALDGVSEATGYRLPLLDDENVDADVMSRGIPIGLIHSMGTDDLPGLVRDAELVTRITHGSPFALSLVGTVARAVSIAARRVRPLLELREAVLVGLPDGAVREALTASRQTKEYGSNPSPAQVLADAIAIVGESNSFQDVLERSVATGGATDTRASLAASLYGGYHGSTAIPQRLIDGLEARIYVSLAVPWFYRTVARRTGRSIDLRFSQDRF